MTTGTTGDGGDAVRVERDRAAMEPRRDDGDDGSKNSGRLTSNVTPSRESCRRAMRSHPLF